MEWALIRAARNAPPLTVSEMYFGVGMTLGEGEGEGEGGREGEGEGEGGREGEGEGGREGEGEGGREGEGEREEEGEREGEGEGDVGAVYQERERLQNNFPMEERLMPYSPSIMVMLKVAGTTGPEPVHSTTNSSRPSTTPSSNTVNYIWDTENEC